MARGLLISFDGLDSSGKATQTAALKNRLKQAGHTVHNFETPDYTTPSGQELKKRLQDSLGWQQKTWQEKNKYFTTNRAEHRSEVISALDAGYIVMYDRYVPSSLAFMTIEAVNQGESESIRDQVHAEVRRVEHEENSMPREDISIFLDVPPVEADKLLQARKQSNLEADEYTDALKVQQQLYHEYELLTSNDPKKYLRVPCTKNSHLLPIDDIAESIWSAILERFPNITHGPTNCN